MVYYCLLSEQKTHKTKQKKNEWNQKFNCFSCHLGIFRRWSENENSVGRFTLISSKEFSSIFCTLHCIAFTHSILIFLFFLIAGFVIAFALCLLLLGVLVTFGFTALVRLAVDHQVALRQGGQTFGWWSKPPVTPVMRLYIYNVTNADEFLNNGSKPILDELGPYVYT